MIGTRRELIQQGGASIAQLHSIYAMEVEAEEGEESSEVVALVKDQSTVSVRDHKSVPQ